MKKTADSSFGGRLKLLRERARLSQRELADKAGMHQFGVAKLEQGLREPSWATVQALAEALGVDCLAFTGKGENGESRPEKRGPGRPPKAAPATPPAEELQAVRKKPRGRPRKGR